MSDVEMRLRELLFDKALELDIQMTGLEIMPNHLHIFVKARPTYAPHFIVQQFKGYTANVLRKEFPHLLKIPSLWTRSYYCKSVGHISENAVLKYIESQKGK